MDELVTCDDGRTRCGYRATDPHFRAYHDHEFGRPSADETRIFEKICIETLASGLSFHMVLARRDLLRDAFHGFEVDRVAQFDDSDVDRLMQTEGVIRNGAKLRACLHNARRARAMRDDDGGLPVFLWAHEPAHWERPDEMRLTWLRNHPTNASSEALAKALKKRGWQWVGPTTCYGVFQGLGLVNDHFDGCAFRQPCLDARAAFVPPGREPPVHVRTQSVDQ
ncbi:MAG: DNA-3-methyladenine glycosylase I [Pseudomonadota bacterium]